MASSSSSSSFSSSSSSSSSWASHPSNYDVFLNFRGDDTRRNFISHLYAALLQKDLQTFFDDDDLKRGDEIVRSLPQAIQNSTVAVLVFSKDYASSSWCLDELAEIIACQRSHGQIVIPVFYEVNPSHLRRISDDVEAAFVKHEQNPDKAHKIPRWRDALITASNLCGFHSEQFRNDHMLINKIVEDILEKLNRSMACDDFENLVGMDSRVKEIKEAFTITSSKINILGIWGMGGIGKTTTAEIIYHEMSRQFRDCCYLRDVRQNSEIGGIKKLEEEFISKVLGGKDSEQSTFGVGCRSFPLKRLSCKKMLILLDDVNDPMQLASLIGTSFRFSPGSIILISSRNKQIFRGVTECIYEVKPLNYDESLQLFSKSAFKQKYPREDFVSLSKSIVEYARGNPLALKVLGSSLIGKKQNEWRSALNQLSKVSNKDIQNVLQISFNNLNRVEKDVFLDIACFFKSASIDVVKKVLKSCDIDADIIISVLEDKCLVSTFEGDLLEMHDLLQKMGKEIVLQEAKYPNQRSRLWDPKDIYEVFVRNKDAEAVESIILDLSKIKEMDLNPQVFMKMPNLKFLSFYGDTNLHLSQGLDYLPNTLRYLRWDKYPLKSFPPNFQPENLVVLKVSDNNINQLWNRIEENSAYRIRSIIVNSFWRLVRLTSLSLVNNQSITHLPNSRSVLLEALEVLDLSGCSNLKTFPEISRNIKKLHLDRTAIKYVPSSSVELLSKLECLRMNGCRELESLPRNFCRLTSLKELHLFRCSRFKELPEILEPMNNLNYLYLNRTAVAKLPYFFFNLTGLKHLGLNDCWKFAFPAKSFDGLTSLSLLEDYHGLDLSLVKLITMNRWRRSHKNGSYRSLIESLELSRNDFEEIPTMEHLPRLNHLAINNCERLLSLRAQSCRSLKEIRTLESLSLDPQACAYGFDLRNCFMLLEDKCQAAVNALLRNYTSPRTQVAPWASFQMIYPGSRIPQWVEYRSIGDSIQIHLPAHWFSHLFKGFVFYLCHDNINVGYDDGRSCDLSYACYFGDGHHFSSSETIYGAPDRADKEHMLVFICEELRTWICGHGNFKEDVAFFKFSMNNNKIKECGIIPLYTGQIRMNFVTKISSRWMDGAYDRRQETLLMRCEEIKQSFRFPANSSFKVSSPTLISKIAKC